MANIAYFGVILPFAMNAGLVVKYLPSILLWRLPDAESFMQASSCSARLLYVSPLKVSGKLPQPYGGRSSGNRGKVRFSVSGLPDLSNLQAWLCGVKA